jgi:hypothetical protein
MRTTRFAAARHALRLRALCGLALIVCLQLGLLSHPGMHEPGDAGCEICGVLGQLAGAVPPGVRPVALAPTLTPLPPPAPSDVQDVDDAAFHARAPPRPEPAA